MSLTNLNTFKERRQAWVEALRSGRFRQGRGRLHNAGGYCCLGVACQVAREHGVPLEVDDSQINDVVFYDGEATFLPDSVMRWLGVRVNDGEFFDVDAEGDTNTLADLNDTYHKTFPEIASVIESEPDGLFVDEAEGASHGD